MKDLSVNFTLPLLLLLSASTVVLAGCQNSENKISSHVSNTSIADKSVDSVKNNSTQHASLTKAISTIEPPTTTAQATNSQQIQPLALDIQHSLATYDFESITPYIHPTKGIRLVCMRMYSLSRTKFSPVSNLHSI